MEYVLLAVLLFGLVIYGLGCLASVSIGFVFKKSAHVKAWQACGKWAVIFGLPLSIIIETYFSFNPNDGFYLDRLSQVTFSPAPPSAKVVTKIPSLFGFHSGESCAHARIELSSADYAELFNNTDADGRFINAEIWNQKHSPNHEFSKDYFPEMESRGRLNDNGIIATKSIYIHANQKPGSHIPYALIFLSDDRHIDYYACI